MRNAGLEEAQAGIKIAGRNINNLRYADDTTVKAENIQFSSVIQLCLTLCEPMDCSTPGSPVHYQLLELAQTHVHRVSLPPNHLILSSPSPAFTLSQHQGLFQ